MDKRGFLKACASFSLVAFNLAVSCALVSVRRTVVAQSDTVTVARLAVTAMASSSKLSLFWMILLAKEYLVSAVVFWTLRQ